MQPPDPAPDPAHVNAGGEAPAPLREAGARGGPSPVAGCASRERSRGRRALDPKLPGSRFGGESPRRWGRRTPQSEVRSSRVARPGRADGPDGAARPQSEAPRVFPCRRDAGVPGAGRPQSGLPGVFPCRRDAGVPGAGRPQSGAPRSLPVPAGRRRTRGGASPNPGSPGLPVPAGRRRTRGGAAPIRAPRSLPVPAGRRRTRGGAAPNPGSPGRARLDWLSGFGFFSSRRFPVPGTFR